MFEEGTDEAHLRFVVFAAGDEIRVVFERRGKLHLDRGVGVHRLRQRPGAGGRFGSPGRAFRDFAVGNGVTLVGAVPTFMGWEDTADLVREQG